LLCLQLIKSNKIKSPTLNPRDVISFFSRGGKILTNFLVGQNIKIKINLCAKNVTFLKFKGPCPPPPITYLIKPKQSNRLIVFSLVVLINYSQLIIVSLTPTLNPNQSNGLKYKIAAATKYSDVSMSTSASLRH